MGTGVMGRSIGTEWLDYKGMRVLDLFVTVHPAALLKPLFAGRRLATDCGLSNMK